MNSDCKRSMACVNNKCKNPCPGTCGLNAVCTVVHHNPICACMPGYTGDSLTTCLLIPKARKLSFFSATKTLFFFFYFFCSFPLLTFILINVALTKPKPRFPCEDNPCGPHSQCRVVNDRAVCSCQQFCIGSPPNCRPECIVSAECPQDRACINTRCQDPCPGTCGVNARCQVVGHNPICSCPNGYTGDPFILCSVEVKSKNKHLCKCEEMFRKSRISALNKFLLHFFITCIYTVHNFQSLYHCTSTFSLYFSIEY